MVIQDFNVDYNRSNLVEFAFFNVAKFLTVLQKPSLKYETNINKLIRVFPNLIWVLIIISYLILCSINILKSGKNSMKIFFEYFGLILLQSLNTKTHYRIILVTWLISSFILTFLFKNDILANVMSTKLEYISDLDSLFNDKFKVTLKKYSYYGNYLQKVSYISISSTINIFDHNRRNLNYSK